MFVAVVNSKGGVGKSTLAVHAAVWLHERGLRVSVIDADAQGSTAEWLARAAPRIRVVQQSESAEILDIVPRLQVGADVIVGDGPAGLGAATAALIGAADRILMPIGASMMDVNASYGTARMIYRVRFQARRSGGPEAYTVFNRVQPRTRLAKAAGEAVTRYGFPVAPQVLQLRQAYADACGRGSVVWRLGAAARDAALEIEALFAQVLGVAQPAGGAEASPHALQRVKDALVLKQRTAPTSELIADLRTPPSRPAPSPAGHPGVAEASRDE
jgi:chromosome partitioning protein